MSTDDEDYDINQSRENYLEDMRRRGMRIVYPASNELLIDIDSEEHYTNYERGIACVLRNKIWDDIDISEVVSTSGLPHRHITITLPNDITPVERIALQAALGSDPMRELMSIIRFINDDPHPTLFVEQPTIYAGPMEDDDGL